ncbi:DUF3017 domain-containing protein [Cellulomonas phragmiteti]|uniref:DUF3017 domain-containing protein n=1 Tax=Cellulomonas phragmiteti TaxID=478780 RepID=A0ABQ4DIE1_9CELL|nr:DUF3017 domain-containing protein [Cellulomonas phragmiteti]GIG39103.1 hypothetical protein Cph01nite_08650 [Cellulomonas phragmiteti]
MSTPARTPAAGLPGPVWPSRPVPPTVPASLAAPSAAPPVATRPEPPAAAEVPAEELPLDPRSIARAALAAGRNRSLWWTMSGIVVAVAVAFVTDAVVGTFALALLLLASAVVRALAPAPGPAAVSVRSKPLDVAVLAGSAATLVVLASVLPPG